MAVHFHSLKVKDIKQETPDCVSVGFDITEELKSLFSFKEGQTLTIKKNIGGEEVRRSYSICTAPHENELRIAVKKIDNGKFSVFANDILKPGDELELLPPTGNFIARISDTNTKNYLAIAAGSGITPIIAIIKHTLQTQAGSCFTLIFGNKDRQSIIFFDELEGLKNKYMQRFNFINILSREITDAPINYGRINIEKLKGLQHIIDYKNFEAAYICGPEEMIFSSAEFLKNAGMDKSKIHFELFTVPGETKIQRSTNEKSSNQQITTGPQSNVTIKVDGRSFNFDLGYNGKNILDAALQQGADLPYACKGGVCCSCRAKLIKGNVDMDVNYALETEEVEQGFILTCQSHPRTEKVEIDFDVK